MKTRRRILIAALGFLTVFMCFWLVAHVLPATKVERYKNWLRSKGEKLEIGEVLPVPVPATNNGAALARSAFALYDESGMEWTNQPAAMRMIAKDKAIVSWAQPDVRGYDFTNSWKNIQAAAAANRAAMELLRQASDYPTMDFQPAYEKTVDMMLPYLSSLKYGVQELCAAAICDLHDNNTFSATTNLGTALALIHGSHDERTLISQLVCDAMASIAAQANWELLQATNLTDAELAFLQKGWEQLEFVQGMEAAFLMERAGNEATIKKMRSSGTYFNHVTSAFSFAAPDSSTSENEPEGFFQVASKKIWRAGSVTMWRISWTYSDELLALKQDQAVLEALREINTNQFFYPAYGNLQKELFPSPDFLASPGEYYDEFLAAMANDNLHNMFSGFAGALHSAIRKVMAADTCKRIVLTAIALKRFQLKHGIYPEKLSELAPDFLPTLPLDAVDGQPLRYRRNADGTFLLYSVGDNGTDDGGDPSLPADITTTYYNWLDTRDRDWVWPQPATAVEVQKYYADQTGKSN